MRRLDKSHKDYLNESIREHHCFNQSIGKKVAYLYKDISMCILDGTGIELMDIENMENIDAVAIIKKMVWNALENGCEFREEEIENLKEKPIIDFINNMREYNQEIFNQQYLKDPKKNFLINIYKNIEKIKLKQNRMIEDLSNRLMQNLSGDMRTVMDNLADTFTEFMTIIETPEGKIEYEEHIVKPMNRQKVLYEKAKETLFANGWALSEQYIELIKEDVAELQEHKDAVDEYMVDIINDEFIYEILLQWRAMQILERRIHILEESIYALKNQWYHVFMCTMFTQLEGLIIDVFYNYVPEDGKYKSDFIKESIEYMIKHDKEVDGSLLEFYRNIVLGQFRLGEDIEPLNRNAVLHGYNTDYGNKVNAYKVFMLYVCMSNSLNQLV